VTISRDAARALWLVFFSAALATLALATALWLTRPANDLAMGSERLTGSTPERAAESFIEAYRSGEFERAAHFATAELARTLVQPPKQSRSAEHESFIVQESHRLDGQRLRLSGLLLREGQAESEGRSVALTLHKQDERYLVEEITW
jgi:hypothetical protein